MKQRENAMLTQGAGLNYLLPQWSPPVTGGSTGPAFGQVDGVAVAAMESAADRREHTRR